MNLKELEHRLNDSQATNEAKQSSTDEQIANLSQLIAQLTNNVNYMSTTIEDLQANMHSEIAKVN
ncbi:hypothetical protein TorRG33x02_220480 [Trema orientale]|uniref:Uncharacterized protein n=1 Tax=Trema orientale TaxID=63057 RepID=A0A2P5E9B7_TREOI|nr:hypothetical protein TorRG33x02_220480 [Trema orientale]